MGTAHLPLRGVVLVQQQQQQQQQQQHLQQQLLRSHRVTLGSSSAVLYERPKRNGGETILVMIPRQPREIWTQQLRLRRHRLATKVRPAAAFTARLDRLVRSSSNNSRTQDGLVIE